MTNPFGSLDPSGGLSANLVAYGRESAQLARDVMRHWRALDGIEYGPMGQETSMFLSRPAKITPEAERLIQSNPRTGQEFGLFEGPGNLMKNYGQVRNADEDPQTVIPPRMTQPKTAVAPDDPSSLLETIGEWVSDAAPKAGRALRSIATAGLDQLDPRATDTERAARSLARDQSVSGFFSELVNQANTVVQAGRVAANPSVLGELSAGLAAAEVQGTSAEDRYQRRTEAMRLDWAQSTLNTIDRFRRTAATEAMKEGVSGEQVQEAETWSFNAGKMVGMLPLGGLAEVSLANQLKSASMALPAGSLMRSAILRHGLASAGANVLLTPLGTPILPEVDGDVATAVQAQQALLRPSYAQAAGLGFALGAAGAWFSDRVMRLMNVGQYARSVDDVYSGEVYSNFRDPQLNAGPDQIPYGDFEVFNDAPVGRGIDILGQLEAGPAPRTAPTPTEVPPAGPFTAPATTPLSGPIADIAAPGAPRALLEPGEVMIRPGELDQLLQVLDNAPQQDAFGAIVVNAERTQLTQAAVEGTLPQSSALERVYQIANDVDMRAKFVAAADEPDYAPQNYRGNPIKEDVFLLEQAVSELYGDRAVNYVRRALAGKSRQAAFGQLADMFDFVKREVDLRSLGYNQVAPIVETVDGVPNPPLVKPPRVIDPFESQGYQRPQIETQFPQIDDVSGTNPTTNAPVITAATLAPAAGQAIGQASYETQGAQSQLEPSLLAPINPELLQSPAEVAVTAGMGEETAQLVTDPVEATVAPERAAGSPVTGLEIANKFPTDLRDPRGGPVLAYGVGDVTQVMEFGENGSLSLQAGRVGTIYLTADPSEAGGAPTANYLNQEIAGGQYPVSVTPGEQSPRVTNAATAKLAGIRQIDDQVREFERKLRVYDPDSAEAQKARQQINQLRRLESQVRRPVSAVSPFYLVPRATFDLNEGVPSDLFSLDVSERTTTQEALINTLTMLPKMYPAMATKTRTIYEVVNGQRVPRAVNILQNLVERIEGGEFADELGARGVYNILGFDLAGENMAMKGLTVNHMLRMQGIDVLKSRTAPGVSRGNSQISAEGVDNYIVLDARAMVPAYAADSEIEEGLAALHATKQTFAEQIAAKPARPDLPQLKSIGDVDYVNSKLIVDLDEHVMVRYPEDAGDLVRQLRLEFPEYYVQAVTGPRGTPEVYAGVKPMTPTMLAMYEKYGYYPSQGVKDSKNGGIERRVAEVKEQKDGSVDLMLYPLAGAARNAIENGGAIRGKGGKLPKTQRYVAGTSAQPFVENAQAEWDEYKALAAAYMANLNAQGKSQVTSMFDPDAVELKPIILNAYFEMKGIRSSSGKVAMTAYFDGQLVREYQDLFPELANFYRAARDESLDAMDNDVPVSLDELASMRGTYIMRVPGTPQIVVRSNRSAEIQVFANEPEARTYLENYEPVEYDVEVEGSIPSAVGAHPDVGSTPLGTQGRADGVSEDAVTLENDAFDESVDFVLQTQASIEKAYGISFRAEEEAAVREAVSRMSGGEPPENWQAAVSQWALRHIKLTNKLGWLKPNHAHNADVELMFRNAGLDALRPYRDTQILREAHARGIERGNPTYKMLETIRVGTDRKPMNDGTVWRLMSIPNAGARMNYILQNKLDPSVINTVAAMERAVDLMFGDPVAKRAMWSNLVQYVNNLGAKQQINRQTRSTVHQDIYDDAATGLANIDWFVAHAKNVDLLAETVNAIDLMNSMTHSLNYKRYVAGPAQAVKDFWTKVGALQFPTVAGGRGKLFESHANDVLNWVSLMETGRIPMTKDYLIMGLKGAANMMNIPITEGEIKSLVGQGLGNTTRAFMGWSLMPVLRDFLQFTFTTPYAGVPAVTKAIKDLTGSNSKFHFDRLRRLGLASTENELQSARGVFDERRGDGDIISPFDANDVARRAAMQAALDRIANSVPNWARKMQDVGMSLYMKGNTVSRRLSAQAAINAWEASYAKFGSLNAADMVNAGQDWMDSFLDDLMVVQPATGDLIRDKMYAGMVEDAMTTYARYITDVTQGTYGPLNSGKLWRTVTGRTAGIFQNFQMSVFNNMKQMAFGGRIKNAWQRNKLRVGGAMLIGGVDWLAHKYREEEGRDLTMYAPGHAFHSAIPIPGVGILSSPVVGSALNSFEAGQNFVSKFGDYPQRGGASGRGLGGLAAGMLLPAIRPTVNTANAVNDVMNSEEPLSDALTFLLTNKLEPNQTQTFDTFRQQNEMLRSLIQPGQSGGGGAQ